MALLLLVGRAAGAQSGTFVDTSSVVNRAYLTYLGADGAAGADSAGARIIVQQVPGVSLVPSHDTSVVAGTTLVFTHAMQNRGTTTDQFTLTMTGGAGWTPVLYLDANGNGALDAGDTPITTSAPLAPDQTIQLLMVMTAPANAAAGSVGAVSVRAASLMNPAVSATVQDRATILQVAPQLTLSKTAGVLEVKVGDVVPYTLTLHNIGATPITGIVAHDRLPDGMRLATTTVSGADSIRSSGRDLSIYVAGPLAPGSELLLRYAAAVVSPGTASTLVNLAMATANGGILRSDTARASVRVNRGFAMQSRTVIGKVWVDRNGNGKQDDGEEGVAGVRVWSADGQFVTTDANGRFSFRDMNPGTQALRLDTLGLPAGMGMARSEDQIVVVQADGWTTPRVNFRLVPSAAPGAPAPPAAGALPSSLESVAAHPAFSGPGADTVVDSTATPTLPPLRSAEAHREEESRTYVFGPAVRITSPYDGSVIGTNRVYVGVHGEPGQAVALYDGQKRIAEGTLRPDGSADFIGVEVGVGHHRLRVSMHNSWNVDQWDSVLVHRSGEPTAFRYEPTLHTLRIDDSTVTHIRLRLVDQWGVPVTQAPLVTISVHGAELGGVDADPSSVGEQRRVSRDGWLTLTLRAGHDVGPGELSLVLGTARARIPLRILPSLRPLIATGVGQVGIGAGPSSFGAVTVQGGVGNQTSVSVAYDSRRASAGDEFFARGYDPLDESRYPTYGDGSERRVLSSATSDFSARVEHGVDWLEVGDVQTKSFSDDRLGDYARSLTGVRGSLSTGPVVWSGFGSVTHQALERHQLRGDGSSGPFVFGTGIRAGTERIAIEVRAAENAARLISRQELIRNNDYQIDYTTGEVLLSHPVPASDPSGNPVFVVATLEQNEAGDAHFVGGLRMEVDAARWLHVGSVDSLTIGFSGVRDGAGVSAGSGATSLLGTDVRLRRGPVQLGAELVQVHSPDSSAVASRANAMWALPGDRAKVTADWLHVSGGFASSLDPRLASALDELQIGGEWRLTETSSIHLREEWQQFKQFGVERRSTTAGAEELVDGHKVTQELGLSSDEMSTSAAATSTSTSLVGKVTVAVNPRLDAWVDGVHAIDAGASGVPTRPDQVGAGASYLLLPKLRLEASERLVHIAGDSGNYAISSLTARAEGIAGGQLWGGLERVDATRASNDAVLGWSQRVALIGGWSLTTMFERRIGLSRASIADPVRALPFAQTESNRWSGSAGLEWLPIKAQARFSLRSEVTDGTDRHGFRVQMAGDAAISAGTALLMLNDWSQYTAPVVGGSLFSRQDRSVLGMALRPVSSDAFNALVKLDWRRSLNPLGGVALGTPGEDRRLISAADLIWSADAKTEISGRYALRWSVSDVVAPGAAPGTPVADATQSIHLDGQYVGTRVQRAVRDRLLVRLDTRALFEGESHSTAWNIAPSLVARVDARVEVETGYRFGTLKDVDFGANGGLGAFLSVSFRFTEKAFSGPGAFWRERIARDP